MSETPGTYSAPSHAPAPTPRIDWDYWIALRPLALAEIPDAPHYLLLPEIEALLAGAEHHRAYMLMATLWRTGARVSEALALTTKDLYLDTAGVPAMIRIPQAKRRAGRPRRQTSVSRYVPVHTDPQFVAELRRFAGELRAGSRLWPISRQTAWRWIQRAYERAVETGAQLPFQPGVHTFRHSFAVHQVLHHRPETAIQKWLGHSDPDSTRIYLQLLSLDTAHLMDGVSYQR